MKHSTFRRYGLLSQIALFIIFFLINFVENYAPGMFLEALIAASHYTFMVVAVNVIHYLYLLPIHLRGRRILYVVFLILLMSGSIAVNYLIFALLLRFAGEGTLFDWVGPTDVAYDYLVLIITTALTSLYYFVELWFKNISKEAQLRTEKLQAELNFLKSQINPHFLFNTLNNIYSFAQTGNEKTAPMLERLSSILRFMVYDCEENRVGLSKEITVVHDLLEIHKMKNSEQRNIELNVDGVKGYHLIAPLIIVNFVENACKHSNAVTDPNGFIKVSITVDASDQCVLEVVNSFKIKPIADVKYGGIGMENIKKRLALQYDTQYTLQEEKKDGVYRLKLMIPLERKK